jgi:hypothetical protein
MIGIEFPLRFHHYFTVPTRRIALARIVSLDDRYQEILPCDTFIGQEPQVCTFLSRYGLPLRLLVFRRTRLQVMEKS